MGIQAINLNQGDRVWLSRRDGHVLGSTNSVIMVASKPEGSDSHTSITFDAYKWYLGRDAHTVTSGPHFVTVCTSPDAMFEDIMEDA